MRSISGGRRSVARRPGPPAPPAPGRLPGQAARRSCSDRLESSGLLGRSTVVIVTADHGVSFHPGGSRRTVVHARQRRRHRGGAAVRQVPAPAAGARRPARHADDRHPAHHRRRPRRAHAVAGRRPLASGRAGHVTPVSVMSCRPAGGHVHDECGPQSRRARCSRPRAATGPCSVGRESGMYEHIGPHTELLGRPSPRPASTTASRSSGSQHRQRNAAPERSTRFPRVSCRPRVVGEIRRATSPGRNRAGHRPRRFTGGRRRDDAVVHPRGTEPLRYARPRGRIPRGAEHRRRLRPGLEPSAVGARLAFIGGTVTGAAVRARRRRVEPSSLPSGRAERSAWRPAGWPAGSKPSGGRGGHIRLRGWAADLRDQSTARPCRAVLRWTARFFGRPRPSSAGTSPRSRETMQIDPGGLGDRDTPRRGP